MRVVVTGSSGLIGSALVPALEGDGHEVTRLVRRAPSGPPEARWDPEAGTIDRVAVEGAAAVVHLAGATIGRRRFSDAEKRRILESRVQGTSVLSQALAGLAAPPAVLVSASGINYYGDRGDEELTEESPAGHGFLTDVVLAWEGATEPAEKAGIRVVHLRSGIVLSARGGALGRVLPLFKLGVAGRLGSGRQWWSWVSLDDEVGLIRHAITAAEVTGPMNATSPNPVTNAEWTKAVGAALGRPTALPVPAFALQTVLGKGLAEEMILASQRVLPAKALATGYEFRHPEIREAVAAALA